MRLNDRGAAFNPVAAVQVVNAAEGAVRGMVDVPANNPIDGASSGLSGDGFLERADEGDGSLDTVF